MSEKRELTESALAVWRSFDDAAEPQLKRRKEKEKTPISQLRARIEQRAEELEKSHKRIRKAVSLRVREMRVSPRFPPDLLGVLVLQPVVRP